MSHQIVLSQIQQAACQHPDWAAINFQCPLHIAVMSEPFLSHILNGQKTVESRFSLHRIPPYQTVQPNDIVLLKAGPLIGYFIVAWVKYFDLTTYPVMTIARQYEPPIGGDANFWQQQTNKKFATLLGISNFHQLTPFTITKTDRRGWVTIPATPKSFESTNEF